MSDYSLENLIQVLDNPKIDPDKLIQILDSIKFESISEKSLSFANKDKDIELKKEKSNTLEDINQNHLKNCTFAKNVANNSNLIRSNTNFAIGKDSEETDFLNELKIEKYFDPIISEDEIIANTQEDKFCHSGNLSSFTDNDKIYQKNGNNFAEVEETESKTIEENSSNFFKKLEQYKIKAESNLSVKKNILEELHSKDCSFHPKTLNNKIDTSGKVFEKLNSNIGNLKSKMIKKYKDQEIEEFNKNCTFSPKILNFDQIKNYYQTFEIPKSFKKSNSAKKLINFFHYDNYSFKPEIINSYSHTTKFKNYLKQDIIKRLSNNKGSISKKISNMSNNTILLNKDEKCILSQRIQASSKDTKKFIDRQNYFDEKKKENLFIITEKLKAKGKPSINTVSKRLWGSISEDVLERNKKFIQAKENFHIQFLKSEENPKKIPNTNRILITTPRKSINDLVYKPLKEKNEEIQMLKSQIKLTEMKDLTFAQKLNICPNFQNIQSKYNIKISNNLVKQHRNELRDQIIELIINKK